jgi:hypothetical protein
MYENCLQQSQRLDKELIVALIILYDDVCVNTILSLLCSK